MLSPVYYTVMHLSINIFRFYCRYGNLFAVYLNAGRLKLSANIWVVIYIILGKPNSDIFVVGFKTTI